MAGDQRERQADCDDSDEGRLFEDVEKDTDLQEIRYGDRERRQHDDQDKPDKIVEDELDEAAAARPDQGRRQTGLRGVCGLVGHCPTLSNICAIHQPLHSEVLAARAASLEPRAMWHVFEARVLPTLAPQDEGR